MATLQQHAQSLGRWRARRDGSGKPRSAARPSSVTADFVLGTISSRRQATYLFPVLPVVPVVQARLMLQHLADFLAMTEELQKKTLTEQPAVHHPRRAERTGGPGC